MIENKNEAGKNLEKAKQRVANKKRKQNEKKQKAENHHKYIMGGIIMKYFPDCYSYNLMFQLEIGELAEHTSATLRLKRREVMALRHWWWGAIFGENFYEVI